MKTKSKPKQLVCAACQRKIAMGEDIVSLEEGVIGPRGLVPLGKTRYYCNERCLHHDGMDEEDFVAMPPRHP